MSISSSLGEQHEIELPQGVISYRERGSGPPIVFIHAALLNADLWRKVVPLLADDFRCLCPDFPLGAHGIGLNPDADLSPPGFADLIRDFMDAVEIERATLVGTDSGGAMSQIFAARYPDRVNSLVLSNCDTNEHFPPTRVLKILLLAMRVPGLSSALVWMTAQLLRSKRLGRLVAGLFMYDKGAIDQDLWMSYARPLQKLRAVRRDLRKAFAGMNKRYTLEATERLKGCEFPILLAWGEEDRIIFPPIHAERLSEQLPTATLKLIPKAATFVAEDRPDELAILIRQHMTQMVS